jgi:hypothetical protein
MRPAASLAALLLLALPGFAQEEAAFRSPSGNIHCLIIGGDWTTARCDILERTPSFRDRPADCELDWGHAFEVDITGRARLVCAGDTVANPRAAVLDYGGALTLGGITCRSEKTGMTCTNRDGHGFSLSRARQRLF